MTGKPQENNEDSGILATKILQVAQKRYYLDVKENAYGRFLKIAETAQNGRKLGKLKKKIKISVPID